MLGMVEGDVLGLWVGRTAVCMKSWAESSQSWEVEGISTCPKIRKRLVCGEQEIQRWCGVGRSVAAKQYKAVNSDRVESLEGFKQQVWFSEWLLMILCVTCIPSIVEQVITRLKMGFILENVCPWLVLCL